MQYDFLSKFPAIRHNTSDLVVDLEHYQLCFRVV
jgi:hypothetical protein